MKRVRLAAGLLFLGLIATSTALGSSGTTGARAVLKHVPPSRLTSESTSLNWSGYAAFNSTFNDVKGSWVQPAATCNGKSTAASFWLGLDGYNSNTVEQIGTEADCSKGKPAYYAWWEFFPAAAQKITFFPVTPDVTYTAEAQSDGNNVTLTLSGGGNTPESITEGLGGGTLSSAEWIAEAPSMCANTCRELPLTNFGTVNFSDASTKGSPINNSAWSNDPLTMVTANGTVKAAPSILDSTGTSFSITWHHN